MKTRSIAAFAVFFLIFAGLLAVLPLLPLDNELEIYDKTLRLHVIANSDSKEDQELKLKVRDEVFRLVSGYVENCADTKSAEKAIEENVGAISDAAQNAVENEGSDYVVTVETGHELYPTRYYDGESGSFALPAGTYYSLRVKIGKAEGANWWCVLFPPLCLDSAKAKDEMIAAGFTPNQIKILTESESPEYVLKFRFIEIIKEFFESFGG